MPKITIFIDPSDLPAVSEELSRRVEQLEVRRQRITKMEVPERFAEDLGIAQHQGAAMYRGHPAALLRRMPYEIVIEHD